MEVNEEGCFLQGHLPHVDWLKCGKMKDVYYMGLV